VDLDELAPAVRVIRSTR